jgi:hypothetical protein
MRNPLLFLVLGAAVLAGCASPDGNTAAEKKAFTLKKRDTIMAELAVRDPSAKAKIDAAPGYLVMSCFGIHPGFGTFANGYGVVQDNKTGKQTFIRMSRFCIGPGIAVKGYYGVITIGSPEMLAAIESGVWYWTAFAEASFHFGQTGGTAAAEATGKSSEAWMWTHTGVSLELSAGGGKTWPVEELNK